MADWIQSSERLLPAYDYVGGLIMERKHRGPSKSWVDKSLDGINVPPVDQSKRRQMAITVASVSTGKDDCSLLLDMLGINIKDIWS